MADLEKTVANNHNTTKEQERTELHRAIWQIANDLRGSVDGWDFKQYVLGILFYRFISENLTIYINEDERRSGKKDFDYAKLSNKEAEFGRPKPSGKKGFIFYRASFLSMSAPGRARTQTSTKRLSGYSATLKVPPEGRTAKMTSKDCLMTSMSIPPSSGPRWKNGTRSW
jgi:type I restriction enzyme M protein